ncbi:MAG: zinc-ribbon domain containing protein [Pseudomonadota bacterium]
MSQNRDQRQLRRTREKAIRARVRHGDFVHHPRYGDMPIASDTPMPPDPERWLPFVESEACRVFPETLLMGDTIRQALTDHNTRPIYVDVARPCTTCRRWFLFFAQEQRHWYEELGIRTGAEATECTDCRRKRHGEKRDVLRYEALLAAATRTSGEEAELDAIRDRLIERGYIRNNSKAARGAND